MIDDYRLLPSGASRADVLAPRDGYLAGLDAELVGRGAVTLGAGRERVDSVIDPGVGIDIRAAIGAAVRAGEPIMAVSYTDPARFDQARVLLENAIQIADAPPAVVPVIRDVIRSAAYQ